jgi:hypothetical protein
MPPLRAALRQAPSVPNVSVWSVRWFCVNAETRPVRYGNRGAVGCFDLDQNIGRIVAAAQKSDG